MKHPKRFRSGSPPFIDPEFAQALDGGAGATKSVNRHEHYKALQLCRQVQRALNLALADRCADDVTNQLFVDVVSPAPDCGHLLVHVVVPADCPVTEALVRLRRDVGYLRWRVAMAITRKQAPELSFVPLPPGGARDD